MNPGGSPGRAWGSLLLCVAAMTGSGWSAAGQPVPPADPDYDRPPSWLCYPGQADACSRADLTTTVIAVDGRRSIARFRAAKRPAYDCFYVYPTASRDLTPNSDLVPGIDEEILTVQKQAARFRSVCRLFVPMYRQTTIGGTVGRVQASRSPPDRPDEIAYGDVKAAWAHYLAHDNKGRGVVLIGASQGALNLKRLIQDEIEGKPAQSRLIAAYLIGNGVAVPPGRLAGGDFRDIPLCTDADQAGCIVSYASFRATLPPPPDSLFGRLSEQRQAVFGGAMTVGCTNPAALGGGKAAIDSYFDTANRGNFHTPAGPRTLDEKPVTTPYVRLPGLLAAECVTGANTAYLAISINADSASRRVQDFYGDTVMRGAVQPAWGLHTIDIDLLAGDLIALSRRQAAAWSRQAKARPQHSDNQESKEQR